MIIPFRLFTFIINAFLLYIADRLIDDFEIKDGLSTLVDEGIHRDLCITPLNLKPMGFFLVPRLPGWSFQQRIHGGVLPPPHCPDKSGPAGSPTDTLRKDSTLPPVTSKKSIVFLGMVKIARFFKGLSHAFHAGQARLTRYQNMALPDSTVLFRSCFLILPSISRSDAMRWVK
jgi:hypothetical protein